MSSENSPLQLFTYATLLMVPEIWLYLRRMKPLHKYIYTISTHNHRMSPIMRMSMVCPPSYLFTIWDKCEIQLLFHKGAICGAASRDHSLLPPRTHVTKQIGELTVVFLFQYIWVNKSDITNLDFGFLENPCPKNKTFQPWWFRGESYGRNLYRTNYLQQNTT